jgi:hypothetical protein
LGDKHAINGFNSLPDERNALVSDSCINSERAEEPNQGRTEMTTNIWMKRLAAGVMLTAAPALFAIGAAGASNAATGSVDTGPHMSQPSHHATFPGQNRNDGPGTPAHHHHEWHHRR